MKILDPGHKFELESYDGWDGPPQKLQFMKRMGERYPGNISTYPGTNIQEIIRVVISRLRYLNSQIPCIETEQAIGKAKDILYLLEKRAKIVKGRSTYDLTGCYNLEQLPTCNICGHVLCKENHNGN